MALNSGLDSSGRLTGGMLRQYLKIDRVGFNLEGRIEMDGRIEMERDFLTVGINSFL